MTEVAFPHKADSSAPPAHALRAGWFRRALDSDVFYSFRRSKLTMAATTVTALFFLLAIFASLLAVQNPFDPAQLQLMNSRIAPLWTADGQSPFLLVTGVVKSVFGNRLDAMSTLAVLVFAIGLSFWVQYARTVRGSVMVEKNRDYVAAAQLIGLPAPVIMLRHVLPNAMGPILVIATINLALAIITEATLSFLGAGMPDTMPSLGTLIRIGNNYLFAGEWWIVAFPGFALAALIVSINLLGDWLRDALNPKLR